MVISGHALRRAALASSALAMGLALAGPAQATGGSISTPSLLSGGIAGPSVISLTAGTLYDFGLSFTGFSTYSSSNNFGALIYDNASNVVAQVFAIGVGNSGGAVGTGFMASTSGSFNLYLAAFGPPAGLPGAGGYTVTGVSATVTPKEIPVPGPIAGAGLLPIVGFALYMRRRNRAAVAA